MQKRLASVLVSTAIFAGAGIVAIPSETRAAPPLTAYSRLPAVEHVDISPDGAHLAFTTAKGEERSINVIKSTGGSVMSVAIGDTKVRSLDWLSPTHLLLTVSATTGLGGEITKAEVPRVKLIDISTGTATELVRQLRSQLSRKDEGRLWEIPIGPIIGGSWKGKPTAYAQFWSQETGYLNLVRVDLEGGSYSILQTGEDNLSKYLTLPDGTIPAKIVHDERNIKWTLFSHQGQSWKPVFQTQGSIDTPSLYGLGADGKSLLIERFDDAAKQWDMVLVDPDSGAISAPVQIGSNADPVMDHNHRMVGQRTEELFFDYHLTEPSLETGWKTLRPVFKNAQLKLIAFSDDYLRQVWSVEGGGQPLAYFLFDATTKKAVMLGKAYPEVAAADIAEVRAIKYKAADGLEINGFLTLPRTVEPKALPMIVLPHGGPQSRDTAGFDWWAQALASTGYAVFQPNFRGSTDRDEGFVSAGYGEWGRKMQSDLSDGVRKLASTGMIDPKRVCIVGASYGGYAALAGITLDPGVYRCAVSVNGVSDLPVMLDRNLGKYGSRDQSVRYWQRFMGAASPSDPRLAAVSPARHAAKADGPILLIHGKDDTVVPYKHSELMAEALTKAGKPVELVTLPSEDHWLSRAATRQKMLESLMAFLNKHNPPD